MSRFLLQTSIIKGLNTQNVRYLRNLARRDIEPKRIEGKVKTVKKYEDISRIESYKDFINSVRGTKLGDELEIEKEFLKDDYHGGVIERCEKYFGAHAKEEKSLNSTIKKNIIGRKYFKLDKETNLLTHAAKEQIRFLHEHNPLEWNYKVLSECFPISEEGVKKLLKSNYVHTCPQKIKAHDEEVAERWKILKSGKPTNLISPLTQKLYKEGKLVDDFYSGNPKLPTVPQKKKVIEIKKKKVGEFSAIVRSYVEYEKHKLLTNNKETSEETQVSLRDNSSVELPKISKKALKEGKFYSEESNDRDPEVYPYREKRYIDYSEIPFSQFKEILKDETSRKLSLGKKKDEYDEFVLKQTSVIEKPNNVPKESRISQDAFLKIPKYERNNTIEVIHEKYKNTSDVYKYDEKLGYQYPVGKTIKNKINIPPKHNKKGKLHKIGQTMYGDDGEFLYKVPT